MLKALFSCLSPAGEQVYVYTIVNSEINSIVSIFGTVAIKVKEIIVSDAYIEVLEENNVSTLNVVESMSMEEQEIATFINFKIDTKYCLWILFIIWMLKYTV